MTDKNCIQSLPGAILRNAGRLKAETILAHVLAGGCPKEDLAIGTGQFFQRAYSNDIANATLLEDEWRNATIQIQLSRPGFYDMLPEGLFFQPAGAEYNGTMGVTEMAALYRWNKTKEKGIRNFFQPFEHAAFCQLLQLEEEERALLQGLEEGMLHRYFRTFWDLPDNISDTAAGYFIRLIPYAHRIGGQQDLMQRCLELLLGEPATIRIVPSAPTRIDRQLQRGLGEQSLGEDTVCGHSFLEAYPIYQYIVGPLDPGKVKDYLPGGDRYTVIATFNRFFVPAGADTTTQIEIDRRTAEMRLEPGKEPLLGYSSVLTA